MKRLREVLIGINQPRILDIATGSGQFVETIKDLCNHYSEIIGIDTNINAIERATETLGDSKTHFRVKDVFDLSDLGEFDVVTISNSMHHFDDFSAVLKSVESVLRKDGIVILQEMYNNHLEEKQLVHVAFHHFWAGIDRLNGLSHNDTFKREEIIETLKKMISYKVKETWVKINEEEPVITLDDMIMLRNSLKRYADRTSEDIDHVKYLNEAEILEEQLDAIGFELASQIIVILKKFDLNVTS